MFALGASVNVLPLSVNFLGTNSPLSKDCYEFFDEFVQKMFSYRNLSFGE